MQTPADAARLTIKTIDALKASLEVLIAADDAYYGAAVASGLTAETHTALACLRAADDFLQQAAMSAATGAGIASQEVLEPFRWAVMKIVEFNAMLPEGVRGDLSSDCFKKRKGGGGRQGRNPLHKELPLP